MQADHLQKYASLLIYIASLHSGQQLSSTVNIAPRTGFGFGLNCCSLHTHVGEIIACVSAGQLQRCAYATQGDLSTIGHSEVFADLD